MARKSTPTTNESLLAFHRLGKFVLKADPESIDPDTGRRAKGSFERLRKQKRRGRNELAKARKFARLYNAAKLKWICSLGQDEGQPLTKSHVCRLVVVRKSNLRDKLASQCAKRAWSVLRLEYEIQKVQRKRDYGGRQLHRPQSVVEALAETERLATRWIRWAGVLAPTDHNKAKVPGELPRGLRKRQIAITTEMKKLQRQIRRRLERITKMPRKRTRRRGS